MTHGICFNPLDGTWQSQEGMRSGSRSFSSTAAPAARFLDWPCRAPKETKCTIVLNVQQWVQCCSRILDHLDFEEPSLHLRTFQHPCENGLWNSSGAVRDTRDLRCWSRFPSWNSVVFKNIQPNKTIKWRFLVTQPVKNHLIFPFLFPFGSPRFHLHNFTGVHQFGRCQRPPRREALHHHLSTPLEKATMLHLLGASCCCVLVEKSCCHCLVVFIPRHGWKTIERSFKTSRVSAKPTSQKSTICFLQIQILSVPVQPSASISRVTPNKFRSTGNRTGRT